MKKYLLLGIITLAGIFNFSSAENYTLTYNVDSYWEYSPNLLTFSDSVDLSVVDYICNYDVCKINVMMPEDYTDVCMIWYNYDGNGKFINTCNSLTAGTYLFGGAVEAVFDTITLSDGNNSGGGEGGDTGGGIITGGINAFSGIIDRLGSIFGEFGPYIIYIAIACLGISLLFKALKYILGFTNNSAKNSIGGRSEMKERRNRRRRNRRIQRYIYRNERRKGGETYGQYYKRKRVNNRPKFGSRGYNSRKE